MPHRIFVSHSTRDTQIAAFLHTELQKRGAEVFSVSRSLKPGVSLRAQIESQLTTSDAVLILVSAASLESAWVRQVIEFARIRRKRTLALLLEDTLDPDHPLIPAERMRFLHQTDCVDQVCRTLGIGRKCTSVPEEFGALDLSWITTDMELHDGFALAFEFDDLFFALTDTPKPETPAAPPKPVIDLFGSMDDAE